MHSVQGVGHHPMPTGSSSPQLTLAREFSFRFPEHNRICFRLLGLMGSWIFEAVRYSIFSIANGVRNQICRATEGAHESPVVCKQSWKQRRHSRHRQCPGPARCNSARVSAAVVLSPCPVLILRKNTIPCRSIRNADGYAVSCGASHRSPYWLVNL